MLRDFYQANLRRVYDFLFFKVLSAEVAEDLTSETFLAFAERVESGQKIDTPSSFIMGIAFNKLQGYLREKYRMPISELDLERLPAQINEVDSFVEEAKTSATLEDLLVNYLDELPPQQREIIELRLIKKLNLQEICDKIGKSMSYVKTTQNRALKNLQKAIACKPVDTN